METEPKEEKESEEIASDSDSFNKSEEGDYCIISDTECAKLQQH